MSDRSKFGQSFQRAVENVRVGGNFTIDTIIQVVGQRQPVFPKPTGIPKNIPPSGATQFVGRAHNLETIHQQLQRTDRVAISAISGMGGVGKTELAIQYATLYTSSYPGGVCWLKARESNLRDQLVNFVQFYLGLAVPQDLWGKTLNLEQQVQWCWQYWRPSGLVLVVLDDVTDLASCREVLPPQDRFRVLVTTREQQLGPSFFEFSLDVLSPEASLELLTALVGQSQIERDVAKAKKLCEWLGYLPLGLELIGRYLAEDPELSFTEMLERLEVRRLNDEAITNERRQNNYHFMTAQYSIKAAFELSWQELDTAASDVAPILSLFALDVISWELVALVAHRLKWSDETINNARKQLYKRNIVQQTSEGYYKVHPLIREFLYEKLIDSGAANDLRQAFAKSMATVAQEVPKSLTLEKIQELTPVISHVAEVTKEMTKYLNEQELCQPFVGLARFYEAQGLYNVAEPWRQKCLSAVQTRISIKHPTVDVGSLHELATLYSFQERYSEAEFLFSSEDCLNIAESLHGLAQVYLGQGRYTEAETLFVQALEIRKRLLGDNSPLVADSLNDLATLYQQMGRYSEAEIFYEQALKFRQRLLGNDHLDVADTLNRLACLLVERSHLKRVDNSLPSPSYAKAKLLFTQSLELSKRLLGDYHPQVAENLYGLGMFYYVKGHYQKAEPLHKQALEIWERSLGKDHPDFAQGLSSLGILYIAQGRYRKAESLLVKALDILRHSLSMEHPQVAIVLSNLASLYLAQGRYHKAETLSLQALELAKQTLGINHRYVSLLHKFSSLIILYAVLNGMWVLYILIDLLLIFNEEVPFFIIAMVSLSIVRGQIYASLFIILSLTILAAIFHWETGSDLFLTIFSLTIYAILYKASKLGFQMNLFFTSVSASSWLLTKLGKLVYSYTRFIYDLNCSLYKIIRLRLLQVLAKIKNP